MGVSRDTVRRWLRVGWLNVRRDGDGHHVIWADADELTRMARLRTCPRGWSDEPVLAQLTKPKVRDHN